MENLHHIHVFASDLEKSVAFYRDVFGGEIVLDSDFAGSRNVFMKIGNGKIHFYDKSPTKEGRGAIHHIGVQTEDLNRVIEKYLASGFQLKNEVKDFGLWKYIMLEGPDEILIELFQVDNDQIPTELQKYFK